MRTHDDEDDNDGSMSSVMHFANALFGKLLVRPWPDQPDRVLRLCIAVCIVRCFVV